MLIGKVVEMSLRITIYLTATENKQLQQIAKDHGICRITHLDTLKKRPEGRRGCDVKNEVKQWGWV